LTNASHVNASSWERFWHREHERAADSHRLERVRPAERHATEFLDGISSAPSEVLLDVVGLAFNVDRRAGRLAGQ
jgi:hypothetical protein